MIYWEEPTSIKRELRRTLTWLLLPVMTSSAKPKSAEKLYNSFSRHRLGTVNQTQFVVSEISSKFDRPNKRRVWNQNRISRGCCCPHWNQDFSTTSSPFSWQSAGSIVHSHPPFSPPYCREKELASTGSGWCPDRGMMGRGNGKCYPTLLLLHGSAPCVSPYTPSFSPLTLAFSFFSSSLFSLVHFAPFSSSTPPPPPPPPPPAALLSSLGLTVSSYNGVFLAERALRFLDACVLSYLSMGKRRGAWGSRSELSSDWLPMNIEKRGEEGEEYPVL